MHLWHVKLLTQLKKSWMWKLTDIAYFSTAQAVAPMDLLVVHFQDHWRKKGQQSISKMIAVLPYTESKQDNLFVNLQPDDTVIGVTSNMEPCTWIHQSRIPTLKHIVSIFQALA